MPPGAANCPSGMAQGAPLQTCRAAIVPEATRRRTVILLTLRMEAASLTVSSPRSAISPGRWTGTRWCERKLRIRASVHALPRPVFLPSRLSVAAIAPSACCLASVRIRSPTSASVLQRCCPVRLRRTECCSASNPDPNGSCKINKLGSRSASKSRAGQQSGRADIHRQPARS